MKVTKAQSIYVPVCLWTFVPSKSSSIWKNLKNKPDVDLGKIDVSYYLTSECVGF